jgi:RNA polymerase sigma-70 factor (ECF subfamily)
MSQFPGIDVAPDLIRAACAGDARAHEAIYRRCERQVYTLIRRLVPRPAIADELFQETFVEILRSIRDYSGQGSFAGWVRSIAVNKCLMYLRSPWHRSLTFLEDQGEDGSAELRDETPCPDVAALAGTDVERALAELPPLTRSIVWLHDVEGYTHGEIARLVGRTTSFSKSQLARAHARLRERLDPQAESLSCTHVSNNC